MSTSVKFIGFLLSSTISPECMVLMSISGPIGMFIFTSRVFFLSLMDEIANILI